MADDAARPVGQKADTDKAQKLARNFTFSESILSGETADVYFQRAQSVLGEEGLNPVVVMEVFSNAHGTLSGMKEVLDLLRVVLNRGAEVWAIEEGQVFRPKQVVLRIKDRYSPFGLYETAILGILAQGSGWATAARECVGAAAGVPVISFGARHVHPRVADILDYAAIVGGCITGSTPLGSQLRGLAPSGTMPHALILIFGDTVRAALAFNKHMPPDVPRVVLVDTFKDEAEESLRVAEALGKELFGVRLDTPAERGRVTADLVTEVRARLDLAGFQHVKIIVSGGLTPERIRYFHDNGAPVDSFGVGSYISGARPIDFTGDLKEIEGKPVAKRGRIPGLTPTPELREIDLWK
ncbi:MAG: nicotinate phosphoribosyltransferase [Chloroflexi bacterium]|nr:nicotinate phosphoribosyltransferase [Chloroflexota bacterium]